jgi:hypothetical protein
VIPFNHAFLVSTIYKALEGIPITLGERYQASEVWTTSLKGIPFGSIEEFCPHYNMELEKHVLRSTETVASNKSVDYSAATMLTPLTPVVLSETIESSQNTHSRNFASEKLNYLEFEHGLAPPDPWDTPKTMHDELRELYGGFMAPDTAAHPTNDRLSTYFSNKMSLSSSKR